MQQRDVLGERTEEMPRHLAGLTLQGEVDPLRTRQRKEEVVTLYDNYPNHPLNGVPQRVLNPAREVMAGAVVWKDVAEEAADPLADAVTMALLEAGFITWEGK